MLVIQIIEFLHDCVILVRDLNLRRAFGINPFSILNKTYQGELSFSSDGCSVQWLVIHK